MHSHSARSPVAIALVLGAAMLWGTTGTAQSLGSGQLPSPWVGALRLLVAALFFGAMVGLLRMRSGATAGTERLPLPWTGIAGAALCMTLYNLAFFAGVRSTGVAVGTAVALGSSPLWAGLMEAAATRRMPRAGWMAGTLLAVAGGATMLLASAAPSGASRVGGPADLVGIGLCLTAGLSYAVYARLNQRVVQAPGCRPEHATGAIFALAAAAALPIAWGLSGTPAPAIRDLGVVLWLGVMSTGVAYLMLSRALTRLPSATAVTLSLAEPVTAFALAVAVVGERPGGTAFAGLAAVLAGLAIVVRTEVRPDRP